MTRVDALDSAVSGKSISRRRLIKRAAIGAGVVYAAPVMTSSAYASAPSCGTIHTPAGNVKCDPDLGGCAGQTPCKGDVPAGSFCTCVPKCGGKGEVQQGCFCHEVQFCAGLTPCEKTGDCPAGFKCTASCCPGGCFCLPPCGTNPIFGSVVELRAANGATTVG